MFRLLSVSLLAFTLGSATSQAALFSGPAAFTTTPWSQMGSVTNNLVITNTPTGFVVSGQAIINVGSSSTGLLVEWIVERPLDPTYAGPFNLQTTTILSGFSAPPAGTFSPTSGIAKSEFTSHPTSVSAIPVGLVNGIDSPLWSSLTATSPVFVYTPAAGLVLRQHFWVDGVVLSVRAATGSSMSLWNPRRMWLRTSSPSRRLFGWPVPAFCCGDWPPGSGVSDD